MNPIFQDRLEPLLIDKPADWTSFDVVAKIRSKIRADFKNRDQKPTKRQLKVGHAGTLDPFATGLLIILKGEQCKKADQFLKLDKVYEATFVLGETSTTGDSEGQISQCSTLRPSLLQVEKTLTSFEGKIWQKPPSFSAIKVHGQRAYKLARQGKVVDLPARQVDIHRLELIAYDYPNLKVKAHVGSGTYIRSLAEDIGTALGTGAYCAQLRRTKIGDFKIQDAQKIE